MADLDISNDTSSYTGSSLFCIFSDVAMAQKSLLRKFEHSYLKLWSYRIRKCSTESSEKDGVKNMSIKYVNEVKLLGYVGQNPKKYEITNKFVTYFSLATSRYYLDKSDCKQKYTIWHTILVRNPYLQDYVMKYVLKGARVYVSGYLDDYNFDFTEELQARGPVHIVAKEVIHLKKSQYSPDENSPYFVSIPDSYRAYD